MSISASLRAEAAKRILVKDGAYGTSIQDRKLQTADYCGGLDLMKDQRGNNDLLNITKPEVVGSICKSFAEAGAEILATNTFNANAISQTDHGEGELAGRYQHLHIDRQDVDALERNSPNLCLHVRSPLISGEQL